MKGIGKFFIFSGLLIVLTTTCNFNNPQALQFGSIQISPNYKSNSDGNSTKIQSIIIDQIRVTIINEANGINKSQNLIKNGDYFEGRLLVPADNGYRCAWASRSRTRCTTFWSGCPARISTSSSLPSSSRGRWAGTWPTCSTTSPTPSGSATASRARSAPSPPRGSCRGPSSRFCRSSSACSSTRGAPTSCAP